MTAAESLAPAAPHPALAAAFAALDEAAVDWCLPWGDEALDAPPGDVDLLVAPTHAAAAAEALQRVGFVRLPTSDPRSEIFLRFDAEEERTLELEVASELAFARCGVRVSADEILARRRRDGPVALPAPSDAFWILLLRSLEKRALPPRRSTRLLALATHASSRPGPTLEPMRRRHTAHRTVLRALRRPGTLLRRRGTSVALLGADGAGKSTLANGLRDVLPLPVRVVYMGLWQGDEGRGPASHALRVALRPARAWRAYAAGAWHRSLGRIVIFDRYTYDAYLPPAPPFVRLKRLYFALLARSCPRPDLVVLLDLPSHVAERRKLERPAARASYLALQDRVRPVEVVDASRGRAEVRADVAARVWEHVARRWTTRAVAGHAHDRYVRGSTLLLFANGVAQLSELGALTLLVRYLSKADYGAFAYAYAFVFLFKFLALFDLPDTLARFVPIYREQRRDGAVLGSVVLAGGLVAAIGTVVAGALAAAVLVLGVAPTSDPRALTLVALLAPLIPLEALDTLLTSVFATLAGPRAIFVRRAVVAPAAKLGLVGGMIAAGAGIHTIALGYLAVTGSGLLAYLVMLVPILRRAAPSAWLRRRALELPLRELLSFAAPLLVSTLLWVVMESTDSLLLGYFKGSTAVATFRAVLPVSFLTKGIAITFALLYVPAVARLYARRDRVEIAALYRQAALWTTLIAFPVFLATFSFARSTTVGLFGARYGDAVPVMATLAVGYFANVAFGFNSLTLRIFGRLRASVGIDLAAAVANVALNLALVPRYGPIGAAAGTATTLVLLNVLKQIALARCTGVTLSWREVGRPYAVLAALALLLLGVEAATPLGFPAALAAAGAAGCAAIWANRRAARLATVFPLHAVPGLRLLLGGTS